MRYFATVTVWSAGKYRYVHSIVNYLFKKLPYPDLILTRDDLNEKQRKPLSTVFEKYRDTHPGLDMGYHNTWLLDDNNHNYIYDNPNNGILIPPFAPAPNIKDMQVVDNRLLQVKAWLEWDIVKKSRDVRNLNTRDIFITSLEQLENKNRDISKVPSNLEETSNQSDEYNDSHYLLSWFY